MEELKHWKKNLDPDWIGCYILPNEKDPIMVKILRVEFIENAKVGGHKKDSYVATFEKNKYFDKPMLLNVTNMKRLTALTKTGLYATWQNVNVTLQREWDKVPTGGKDWGLRISSIAPVSKTIADYPETSKMLNACTTLIDLAEVYKKLDREQQGLFVVLKNELKTKLL